MSQASVVWGLVSLYLDSTTDVLERSERLGDQEYKLIGPALHLLLSKANSSELKTLLAFLHTTIHKIRSGLPMAELVGCGTPCLLGSLGVREVVGSRPGWGSSKESFTSYQETGKVFSPEMPFYSKF